MQPEVEPRGIMIRTYEPAWGWVMRPATLADIARVAAAQGMTVEQATAPENLMVPNAPA